MMQIAGYGDIVFDSDDDTSADDDDADYDTADDGDDDDAPPTLIKLKTYFVSYSTLYFSRIC